MAPQILVIQAREERLVATKNLDSNAIDGPFYIRETDFDKYFVFCSLTSRINQSSFSYSTIEFVELGTFLISTVYEIDGNENSEDNYLINDKTWKRLHYCLYTYRLQSVHQTDSKIYPQSCQLLVHFLENQVVLQMFGNDARCIFHPDNENSTLIASDIVHIFIERIDPSSNSKRAFGVTFHKTPLYNIQVSEGKWVIISTKTAYYVSDNCILKTIDQKRSRQNIVHVKPTDTVLIYEEVNDYRTAIYNAVSQYTTVFDRSQYLYKENENIIHLGNERFKKEIDNEIYLTVSAYANRKTILRQWFQMSELGCVFPSTQTITYVTKCLENSVIRTIFDENMKLPVKLQTILPVGYYQIVYETILCFSQFNFQLNRYAVGYESVITYNVQFWNMPSYAKHLNPGNICDALERCECVTSLTSIQYPIACADVTRGSRLAYERSVLVVHSMLENFPRLSDNDLKIFKILTNPLPRSKRIFAGPYLRLQLMIDFGILVTIREQNDQLLSYRHLIPTKKRDNYYAYRSNDIDLQFGEDERAARTLNLLVAHEQQRRHGIFVTPDNERPQTKGEDKTYSSYDQVTSLVSSTFLSSSDSYQNIQYSLRSGSLMTSSPMSSDSTVLKHTVNQLVKSFKDNKKELPGPQQLFPQRDKRNSIRKQPFIIPRIDIKESITTPNELLLPVIESPYMLPLLSTTNLLRSDQT
ncbi:unnamed protein product [Didymodactylos carnosus]|uniref:Uncharacterized protein n=1 Tax=Didymodactylos carnosus TaxID=1234261 RepID=A0A813SBA0_9BILA|nr:unnamed protein product [Didymodactylos carnosus]CAF3581574.1 unnamed protein product [Didymodactylos carnosus]